MGSADTVMHPPIRVEAAMNDECIYYSDSPGYCPTHTQGFCTPRDECRFDKDAYCTTHATDGRAAPALCGTAAAALQARVADRERVNAAHIARIQHLSAEVARYMANQEVGEARVRELEASVAELLWFAEQDKQRIARLTLKLTGADNEIARLNQEIAARITGQYRP